ncbi:MAG: succinate dehydrogenase iron-sulfur subunit [Chloroflexi bacterium]|jgi:succinate dehydrogenase / fumarate reductase iron-sulfur subunit|nr:succinate dehydrogenase iron-sulfur subunit [Chloroflexota bacterium]
MARANARRVVTLEIQRFNPEIDSAPHQQSFQVEADPSDRVLDLLNRIKWFQDGTLAFRRSCGQGICGSDAMCINGRNRLACKVLVKNLGEHISVRPLPGFRVIKDLVVDLRPFFQHYIEVMPYLINDERPPATERLQSPEERARYDDTTKCILCAACTGACPPFWANGRFIGPAALVNAHRFIFDSRDRGRAERLAILNQRFGAWGCRDVGNCTEACPRGIQVQDAIDQCKRAILAELT